MTDYIKREDAFLAAYNTEGSLTKVDRHEVEQFICRIPSADVVERKRGAWIVCTKDGLYLTETMRREGKTWYGYRCTECNFIYKGNALRDFNFCPNCGASMGEREGE